MTEKFYGKITNIRMHKKTIFADVLNENEKNQLLINREIFDKQSFNEGTVISGRGNTSTSKTGDKVIVPEHYDLLLKPKDYQGEDYSYRNFILEKSKLIEIVRSELKNHKFFEVVTPSLLSYPGNSDIDSFVTTTKEHQQKYLRFTLEMELKKIASKTQFPVYELGNVFRNMGRDRKHPTKEYTVLEAIYPYASFEEGIKICLNILNRYANSVKKSLQDPIRKNIMHELSMYPNTDWKNEYKKNIRLTKNLTIFTNPPCNWSPLAKKNYDNTAQDAEIIYKELALAHICDENNDIDEILNALENQCRNNSKTMKDIDPEFLQAFRHGLPPSVGFCMGLDRIISLFSEAK